MSYIEDMTNLQQQMNNYMERLNAGRLSNKDSSLIVQVAGSYYEAFEKYQNQEQLTADHRETISNILDEISKFQDSIIKGDNQEIRAAYEAFSQIADTIILEAQRQDQLMEVFQTDLQEMDLRETKIKTLQSIVDIDLKIYGEITKATLEVLDVQNCVLEDGQVKERDRQNEMEKETGEMPDFDSLVTEHEKLLKENSGDRQTLIVNAFAGPGAGKTTACLSTVAELKKMGFTAEYVPEYAKELVYDDSALLDGSEKNQFMILQEQMKRMDRLVGKVDIIVTDAPILLNTIYNAELTKKYEAMVIQLYGQYSNFNFFVKRGNDFEQSGRIQNYEESLQKDRDILALLDKNEFFYGTFNYETLKKLAEKIQVTFNRISGMKKQKDYQATPSDYAPAEQSYKGSAYIKSQGKSTPVVVFGSSPEDIISTLQGQNMARTEEMKLKTCYVRKLDPETNQYKNVAKYDVETGADISPIYLNIPHMERSDFLKTIEQLKKDGASYNPVKKQFFITKQCDLNKFSQYLPIVGTQAETNENHSRNQLSYEVEAGQEYYDNRVKVTVEGMEPFNVFGDDYDVHFPSLSAENTKEIIEKFVLPELEVSKPQKKIVKEVEYNGQKYDPLQYNVLELAIKQNFTQEQMQLLERPELSADRLNEIRFAIRDGLSPDQIAQFATPSHEQWQMDLCRIGMQHGFAYEELKELINPDNYTNGQWGERRNQLAKMIRAREKVHNAPVNSYQPQTEGQKPKAEKDSIVMQLNQNKAKLEAGNKAAEAAERKEPIKGVER